MAGPNVHAGHLLGSLTRFHLKKRNWGGRESLLRVAIIRYVLVCKLLSCYLGEARPLQGEAFPMPHFVDEILPDLLFCDVFSLSPCCLHCRVAVISAIGYKDVDLPSSPSYYAVCVI